MTFPIRSSANLFGNFQLPALISTPADGCLLCMAEFDHVLIIWLINSFLSVRMKAIVFPEWLTTNYVFSTQNKKRLEMIYNDLFPDSSARSCLWGVFSMKGIHLFPKRGHFCSPKYWLKLKFHLSDFLQHMIFNVWEHLRFPRGNMYFSTGNFVSSCTNWWQHIWISRWET